MGYLSADQILDAKDLPCEDVEVPEWGGTVRVRGLDGAERDKFEARFVGDDGKASTKGKALELYRARLVAACVVDEQGKRLFQGDAVVRRLGEKSAVALQRVCDVAMRLSGMSEDDQKELTGN